nr:glucan endo-1,3-beta-glucosidase-like [Tanacetum cinerariifolium]
VVFKLATTRAPLPLSATTITPRPPAEEMKAIQDAITAGTIPPKTNREILAEVTRSTNCAHIAGVGRNLAGTPSSQFQIPDLYTPQVFPCSISTPGGPSSTSPAPSSNPLGLGNCYTPTFDLETSQSGEQEDYNGSDDGNGEYDVDIYDDDQGKLTVRLKLDKQFLPHCKLNLIRLRLAFSSLQLLEVNRFCLSCYNNASCSLTASSKAANPLMTSATLWALKLADKGAKCAYLENRSTTTRTTVKPFDNGIPVMKSIYTSCQTAVAKGSSLWHFNGKTTFQLICLEGSPVLERRKERSYISSLTKKASVVQIAQTDLMASNLLLLSILILKLLIFTDAQSVGVCYGQIGNGLPSEQDVVNLYQRNGINRMRMY